MAENTTPPAPAKSEPKAQRRDEHNGMTDVWVCDPPGPGVTYSIVDADTSEDGRTRRILAVEIHEG